MHMPKYDPETYHPQQSYSAKRLSRYDMQVAGVVIYVVALTVFFVVALVMMLFWNETATMAHAQAAKPERPAISAAQRNDPAGMTPLVPKPDLRAQNTDAQAKH